MLLGNVPRCFFYKGKQRGVLVWRGLLVLQLTVPPPLTRCFQTRSFSPERPPLAALVTCWTFVRHSEYIVPPWKNTPLYSFSPRLLTDSTFSLHLFDFYSRFSLLGPSCFNADSCFRLFCVQTVIKELLTTQEQVPISLHGPIRRLSGTILTQYCGTNSGLSSGLNAAPRAHTWTELNQLAIFHICHSSHTLPLPWIFFLFSFTRQSFLPIFGAGAEFCIV